MSTGIGLYRKHATFCLWNDLLWTVFLPLSRHMVNGQRLHFSANKYIHASDIWLRNTTINQFAHQKARRDHWQAIVRATVDSIPPIARTFDRRQICQTFRDWKMCNEKAVYRSVLGCICHVERWEMKREEERKIMCSRSTWIKPMNAYFGQSIH